MNYSKKHYRQQILQQQKNNLHKLQDRSEALLKQLKNNPLFQKAIHIAVYMPLEHEVQIQSLFIESGKQFYIPKIHNQQMEFYVMDHQFTKNKMGILEPKSTIKMTTCDLMIVPYVAYNTRGYRIGYGGGYYDRYLKNQSFPTILLGIKEYCVDFKEDLYDIAIDVLLETE